MVRNQRPQPTAEDKKNARIGCGIILAALLVIGGCGALSDDNNDSSPTSPSSSTPSSRSSTPSSRSSVDDGAAKTAEVEDFVGMGLQAAQDAAQDDGIYHLDSTDATGQGRMQLWDRNWTVCAQTPAAGETMSTDDTLTFDTVKSSEGETCDDPAGSGSDAYDEGDTSTVSGVEDDYDDDSSSTVAGTGDDYSDDSSSNGSDSSGDDSSSSSSSGGSQQAPAGATAQCNDGTYSYSAHRRGTCSHHGGVAVWLASVPS